ncbi:MAG: Sec-independent protein translocase protein TatB, partial [Geminicoccaceae bacterium]
MFDIGWSEMAIIMLLALIIIGPKDLPRVARTVGQWVRKGRALAREFQTSLEDMARETELDEVKKEIEKVGRTDFKKTVENSIDPKGELGKAFDAPLDEPADEPSKAALPDKSESSAGSLKSKESANGQAGHATTAGTSPPTTSKAPAEKSVKAKTSAKA